MVKVLQPSLILMMILPCLFEKHLFAFGLNQENKAVLSACSHKCKVLTISQWTLPAIKHCPPVYCRTQHNDVSGIGTYTDERTRVGLLALKSVVSIHIYFIN